MIRWFNAFFGMLLAVTFSASAHPQDTKEVHKEGAFSPTGRVYVDTYKGSVTVSTWDNPQIEIRARVEPDGDDRRSFQEVRDTEVRIDLTQNSARLKSDYDRVRRHNHGFLAIFGVDTETLPFVHYSITMPRTASVVIKDYKSDITVADCKANVDVDTYKGDIVAERLLGSIALKNYKGNARVRFVGLAGASRAETYKGDIRISLPHGKGFDVEAQIGKHGKFDCDFDIVKQRRGGRYRDYDVSESVNGGGPLLRLKTEHGSVRLVDE